jgi:hypothetical protein
MIDATPLAELTIEDWSWSQVPPPLLSVVTDASRGRIVIGLADPANGVDENGWLAWTPRRLTPDQADRLADDLRARAAAIRAAQDAP